MDKQEFTARVLAIEGRLYRISCGLLKEEQDRLDAAQEAVIRAWQNLDRLRHEAFFETWLTRILINECRNIQRSLSRVLPLDVVPEQPALPDADGELRRAVAALNVQLRLPVLLKYMEGYRTREIARILKIPEGTVKSRLRRARVELKRMLGEGIT